MNGQLLRKLESVLATDMSLKGLFYPIVGHPRVLSSQSPPPLSFRVGLVS